MLSKNMTWRVGSVIRCDNVMINLSRWSSSVPLAPDANSVYVMIIWVVVVWVIKALWLQGPQPGVNASRAIIQYRPCPSRE